MQEKKKCLFWIWFYNGVKLLKKYVELQFILDFAEGEMVSCLEEWSVRRLSRKS